MKCYIRGVVIINYDERYAIMVQRVGQDLYQNSLSVLLRSLAENETANQ